MPEPRTRSQELKSPGYEIFIGALSVISIVNIVLQYGVNDQSLDNVLLIMDAVFSFTFLIDFSFRLWTAPSKSTYFFRHYGWADLLASLPLAQLKVLRLFRGCASTAFCATTEHGTSSAASFGIEPAARCTSCCSSACSCWSSGASACC